MWVSKLELTNIRSFEKADIVLSKGINILVGPNNAGKSTLLNAALQLQYTKLYPGDLRKSSASGSLQISLDGKSETHFGNQGKDVSLYTVTLQESGSSAVWRLKNGNAIGLAQIPPTEPKNFIYPYLSKRKDVSYSEKINEGIVGVPAKSRYRNSD
ncbi:MAG: AAA family ATPase [Dehalococcoidia bacterium]|nr:AAA family ATPase [Dehalococcoidia bacterium]